MGFNNSQDLTDEEMSDTEEVASDEDEFSSWATAST